MLITLAEIKSFLSITDTTKDSVLTAFILAAESRINSLCNRILSYQEHTEYYQCTDSYWLYLKNFPVDTVTSIKYYDSDTNTYIDLIDSGDTFLECYEIQGSKLILRKGYTFPNNTDIQIVYIAGYKSTKAYKTISAISQSTTYALVTIGTHSYTTGTVFHIDGVTGFLNNPNGSYAVEVATATQIKFTFDLGTGSYVSGGQALFDSTLFNTTPNDLNLAMLYQTAKIYWDSPISGNSRLGVTAKNFNAGASGGISYENIDSQVEKLIQPYKFINV